MFVSPDAQDLSDGVFFYFKGFLAALSKEHGDVLAPCSCQSVFFEKAQSAI